MSISWTRSSTIVMLSRRSLLDFGIARQRRLLCRQGGLQHSPSCRGPLAPGAGHVFRTRRPLEFFASAWLPSVGPRRLYAATVGWSRPGAKCAPQEPCRLRPVVDISWTSGGVVRELFAVFTGMGGRGPAFRRGQRGARRDCAGSSARLGRRAPLADK